jgi:hypothetical protein
MREIPWSGHFLKLGVSTIFKKSNGSATALETLANRPISQAAQFTPGAWG